MSVGFILAIGLILAAALAITVVVARGAGTGADDPGRRSGRELEPQRPGRPNWTPARRQRAMIAILAAALASIGAGMASFLITAAKH